MIKFNDSIVNIRYVLETMYRVYCRVYYRLLRGSDVVPKFIREKLPQCNTFRKPKIHVLTSYMEQLWDMHPLIV